MASCVAVTGRRRLGGYLFSLLLFISVSQRQSNIETIPLAALRLGGSRLFGWGICLSSICCIPIIIADIALGEMARRLSRRKKALWRSL